MPEWQGAGVGFRFLNAICELQERGDPDSRLPGRPTTTIFHTSHPQLCQALRRDRRWRQLSGTLYGNNKARSTASLKKSAEKHTRLGVAAVTTGMGSGFGGHFRAVQGFRYYGAKALAQTAA